MCKDSCEIWLTPTDPRVLMVGLLAQPEQALVGPDDVAELQFWSSSRLLANASSKSVRRREHATKHEHEAHLVKLRKDAWQIPPNNQNDEKNAARLTAKNHKKPNRKDRLKRGMEQREQ